ncbi:MAG: nucleotide exchange factor GrpE [Candidatus Eremiobacteraeota bacterium]|nr:nucleotide exchange factor GrpE [Candidatus Eremiobacteraeota bacterium]
MNTNKSKKKGNSSEVEIPVGIAGNKKDAKPSEVKVKNKITALKKKGKETMSKKLKEEVEEKDKRINELEEQVRRLSAEFENFRRRQEKEVVKIREYAAENVISEFFPFIDSLEKAQEAAEKSVDIETIRKGLEMIGRQLKQTLERLGVNEIKATGEEFNPALHQAIHVEETDEHPDETVLKEFQKGYKYKDRTLRPSIVGVSRTPKNG